MSAFDDLMQEARDAGVQESWLDRIKAATDGSPLRKERDDWKAKAEQLSEQVGKFRSGTLGQQLVALGFKGNPDALKVPDDLDPFDADKVTEWAVGMNLVPKPEPSEDERQHAADLAAHDRMTQAAAGGELPANADETQRARLMGAATQEEFDRILAEGSGHR